MAAVIWLTGMSGAGKTSIASGLLAALKEASIPALSLDGDRVRSGLSRDLGFSPQDRAENVRRVAEVARLLVDEGLLVVVALISPSARERDAARNIIGASRFYEVFVNAPLDVLEQRDPKGLYRLARSGNLSQFTGIDSVYEKPLSPALILHTDDQTLDQSIQTLRTAMSGWGLL